MMHRAVVSGLRASRCTSVRFHRFPRAEARAVATEPSTKGHRGFRYYAVDSQKAADQIPLEQLPCSSASSRCVLSTGIFIGVPRAAKLSRDSLSGLYRFSPESERYDI